MRLIPLARSRNYDFARTHWLIGPVVAVILSLFVFLDPLVFSHLDFYYSTSNLLAFVPFQFAFLSLALLCFVFSFPFFLRRERVDSLLLFLLVVTPYLIVVSTEVIEIGFIVLMMGVWVLFTRFSTEGEARIRISPAFFFLLALIPFFFFSLLSTRLTFPQKIQGLLETLILVVSRPVFFIFIFVFITHTRQIRRVLDYIVIFGLVSGIIGIAQAVYFLSTGIPATFASEWDRWSDMPVIGKMARSSAFLISPNELSVLVGVSIIVLIGYILWDKTLSAKRKLFYWLLVGVLLIAQIPPASPSATMALALVILLIPFVHKPAKLIHVVSVYAVVLTIITLLGITEYLFEEGFEEIAGSSSFRPFVLQNSVEAVIHYPVTGIGYATFEDYNNPFQLKVHNMFVEIAAEFGIPATIVFMCFFFFIFIRLTILALNWRAPPYDLFFKTLFLICVLYLIVGQFQHFGFIKHLWLVLAVTEAAIFISKQERGSLHGHTWSFGSGRSPA